MSFWVGELELREDAEKLSIPEGFDQRRLALAGRGASDLLGVAAGALRRINLGPRRQFTDWRSSSAALN